MKQIIVEESKKVKLAIYVDENTKRNFKVLASNNGKSMGDYFDELVDEKYHVFLQQLDNSGGD